MRSDSESCDINFLKLSKVSIAVPKPGLREANSIEADDKESAVAAYYQQYGYGAAQSQQGYYGQQAGKGPAVLVSSQVRLQMNCYSQSSSPTNRFS